MYNPRKKQLHPKKRHPYKKDNQQKKENNKPSKIGRAKKDNDQVFELKHLLLN